MTSGKAFEHFSDVFESSHSSGSGALRYNKDGHQENFDQSGSYNRMIRAKNVVYHEANRAESPPDPTHTIPFLREKDFVDRSELNELREMLSKSGRVALYGIGGVGKSQLAIEYGYRIREEQRDAWVFWVHASSAARFDGDMRRLADKVGIPGRDEQHANIPELLYHWLSNTRRRWVLVLDNVDDADFLFEASTQTQQDQPTRPRLEYLPICDHGRIVITTRNKAAASRVVARNVIEVRPNKAHAVELLHKRLDSVSGDIEKLALALDYIPLAIVQAAAYINKRYPRFTVEQYIAALEEHEISLDILGEGLAEVQQDLREAKKPIILSWRVSFEHIYDVHRSAAEMLALASFYNHQGIPELLLKTNDREQCWTNEPLQEQNPPKHSPFASFKRIFRRKYVSKRMSKSVNGSGKINNTQTTSSFEDDLNILKDFCFITVTPDGHAFEMHRLVKLAAQVWLKERGKYEEWLQKSLTRLGSVWPSRNRHDWPAARVLYAHVRLLVNAQPKSKEVNLALGRVAEYGFDFAYEQSWYSEAEVMGRRSWIIKKTHLGERDRNTSYSLAALGVVLSNLGEHAEGEQMIVRALGILEQTVGQEDEYIAIVQTELAYIYHNTGRYKEAEDTSRLALQGHGKIHGEGHVHALPSIQCLAMALDRQGKLKEAEMLYREALNLHPEVLAPNDTRRYVVIWHLAQNLEGQGYREDALSFYGQVVSGFTDAFGPAHRHTLQCLQDLESLELSTQQDRNGEDAVAGAKVMTDDVAETNGSPM